MRSSLLVVPAGAVVFPLCPPGFAECRFPQQPGFQSRDVLYPVLWEGTFVPGSGQCFKGQSCPESMTAIPVRRAQKAFSPKPYTWGQPFCPPEYLACAAELPTLRTFPVCGPRETKCPKDSVTCQHECLTGQVAVPQASPLPEAEDVEFAMMQAQPVCRPGFATCVVGVTRCPDGFPVCPSRINCPEGMAFCHEGRTCPRRSLDCGHEAKINLDDLPPSRMQPLCPDGYHACYYGKLCPRIYMLHGAVAPPKYQAACLAACPPITSRCAEGVRGPIPAQVSQSVIEACPDTITADGVLKRYVLPLDDSGTTISSAEVDESLVASSEGKSSHVASIASRSRPVSSAAKYSFKPETSAVQSAVATGGGYAPARKVPLAVKGPYHSLSDPHNRGNAWCWSLQLPPESRFNVAWLVAYELCVRNPQDAHFVTSAEGTVCLTEGGVEINMDRRRHVNERYLIRCVDRQTVRWDEADDRGYECWEKAKTTKRHWVLRKVKDSHKRQDCLEESEAFSEELGGKLVMALHNNGVPGLARCNAKFYNFAVTRVKISGRRAVSFGDAVCVPKTGNVQWKCRFPASMCKSFVH
ncbi:MAG: hypothetical protein KVP17_003182 [Porospora cf. gigantea B]|uniref:uncharacterized protein n=1 Tax=Porospora cf. gigantea B TaxID=2853592 RepID=UPI003571841C|nr:MAG: hypothetical protein KVP17_003182 [Porospora cf. gigantea B]